MLEEDELRWRSGRLRGRWRERISHLSGGHRRMLHEQPSAAAVVRVAKRGKERDAARAGRGRHVVGVPIDVVNQRRGGLIERALWALVELAERVALAHLKRWLLLRPRRSGAPRSSHLSACASAGRRVKMNAPPRVVCLCFSKDLTTVWVRASSVKRCAKKSSYIPVHSPQSPTAAPFSSNG